MTDMFPSDTDFGKPDPNRVRLKGARQLVTKIERMQEAEGEFWDHLQRVKVFAERLGADAVVDALRTYDPADPEFTGCGEGEDIHVLAVANKFLNAIEKALAK